MTSNQFGFQELNPLILPFLPNRPRKETMVTKHCCCYLKLHLAHLFTICQQNHSVKIPRIVQITLLQIRKHLNNNLKSQVENTNNTNSRKQCIEESSEAKKEITRMS